MYSSFRLFLFSSPSSEWSTLDVAVGGGDVVVIVVVDVDVVVAAFLFFIALVLYTPVVWLAYAFFVKYECIPRV